MEIVVGIVAGSRLMATSSIAAARAVLTPIFPGVKIAPELPAPLPGKCIRLTRAGGGRTRELDAPRILVECFASTSGARDIAGAEQMALDAYEALRLASNGGPWAGGWITGWDGNTIADYPDPEQIKHARWQFSGTLYLLNQ